MQPLISLEIEGQETDCEPGLSGETSLRRRAGWAGYDLRVFELVRVPFPFPVMVIVSGRV